MATRSFPLAATFAALLFASNATAEFRSNDLKYRDSSRPHATGRAGNATMEARALLDKRGVTQLEIAAGGGTLSRVQLDLPGQPPQNFNDVAGTTFTRTLPGLPRLAPIGVQVNVDDGTRTGVISATETVKLRPDLVVDGVSIPPHTAIGVPFGVTATIREANGDLGARASCVLLVDGVEADRAAGIWVDAGGAVTCQMSHLFANAGTAQVSIALAGTSPADFDPSNDAAASVAVRVYPDVTALTPWSADAHERTFERRWFSSSPWGSNEIVTSGWSVGMSLFSIYREHLVNVETLRASVYAETDGQTLLDSPDTPIVHRSRFDWDWETQYDCAHGYFDEDHSMVTACRIVSPFFDPYTTVSFNFNAGDATYVSRAWYRTYVGGEPADVHYENSTPEQYGVPFHLGETASFRLRLSDGTRYWDVSPSMTLAPYSYRNEQPLTCWGDWCSASLDAESGKRGNASY